MRRSKSSVVRSEEGDLISVERFSSLRRMVQNRGESMKRERSGVVVVLSPLAVQGLVEDFIDLANQRNTMSNEIGIAGTSERTVYLLKSAMPCCGSPI